MEKIDFSDYMCHGLAGMDIQFEKREDEELRLSNELRNAIISEITDYDIYYDKNKSVLRVPSNGIVTKFYNYIKDSNFRILFGIYRLIQILKTRKIKTFEDISKEQNQLIINDGRQLGVFNSPDTLCFVVKGVNIKDLINGTSLEPGADWRLFIEDAISVVLPYDNSFNAYKKSDKVIQFFWSEIRIKDSIENPNIYAISLPVIYNVENSSSREDTMKYWIGAIEFIRQLLNKYDYKKTRIVDSLGGYDLENKQVIKVFEKVINDGSLKFKGFNNGCKNRSNQYTFLKEIIAYENIREGYCDRV